jgi:hypothetical protein
MSFELQFGEEIFSVSDPLKSWALQDDHGRCSKCKSDLTFGFESRRLWIPQQVRCNCAESLRPLVFVRKLENPHRKKEGQIETDRSPTSIERP